MGVFENPEWFGIAALLIFVLFFLAVLAWVFRPGSTEKYRAWSNIPLKGDPDNQDLTDLAKRDD